ncbi:unnamed protein product [Cuscuta epithymum]|uniref:Uncharacterized protein n=1 Tax=Cuscuta epithymum TaxID=186058 RepID=A0AAV0D5B5_9ASTE|nr:unnamed protein product [Cuscuta epithymum]
MNSSLNIKMENGEQMVCHEQGKDSDTQEIDESEKLNCEDQPDSLNSYGAFYTDKVIKNAIVCNQVRNIGVSNSLRL